MKKDKYDVLQRLTVIELLALWEGRLVTNRLVNWFGISRQQASGDIRRYLTEHNPGSLIHDPSLKAYVPSPTFKPVLTHGHVNEYFDMLSGHSSDTTSAVVETEDCLTGVRLPDRAVRPEVVREVVNACRTGSSLKIVYASMSNPAWAERIISPHSLVYTGFRWHVRAYCHKRNEFRDLLLSRIDRVPKPSEAPAPLPAEDTLWQESVTINLVANLKLSEVQRSLVEVDYGMPEGRLQIVVRKALAHYTIQRYQAAITPEESQDELRYPLMLLPDDRKKIGPYLFGADV
ncbi:WYL domain-containing protein [Zhongshania sp. BJYM1]|uniref:WYL domain-containing protein n=1 Tax=Zhongshania aquatica TaxID=2965069 RepID=UPI0022B317F7|nr:WYL domain-containing protein [Marortus sp. BJYM1]